MLSLKGGVESLDLTPFLKVPPYTGLPQLLAQETPMYHLGTCPGKGYLTVSEQ